MTSRELSIFYELRPTDRSAQTAGAEFSRQQNIIGKHTKRSRRQPEHVVKSDDRAVGQEGPKQFEILFRCFVAMIAIDPKNTNRFAPLRRQILRKTFEHFDEAVHSRPLKVVLEFGITRSFWQIGFTWIGERINRPDVIIAGCASGFAQNNC